MLQRWVRWTMAAVIPPLLAFVVQHAFFGGTARWVLFYPAVFAAAWFAGFSAGVLAAALSAFALVWFIIPPIHTFVMTRGEIFMGSTFFAMSTLMSGLLGLQKRTADERRLFAALIDNSTDFIGIADTSGKPVYLNPAGRRMIGLDPEFPIEKATVSDFYAPNDRDFARTVIAPEAQRRGHWQGETLFRNWKTGATFPVWHNRIFIRDPKTGRHVGGGTITRDLTERKQVEDALRRREADLREAERIAHLGSWSWDLKTNTVHWSDELHRLFHRDPHTPLPKPFDDVEQIFDDPSREKIRAAVDKLLETGEPYELELSANLPDGRQITLQAHGEAVRDEEGTIVRINGTALDITKLKNLERLRDEWTSVIAHDLRQPIGFITMAASALPDLREGPTSDAERQLMERIAAAGRNLARMVDDLLAVSLLEAHRMVLEQQWMNPRGLVDDTIARVEHLTADRPIRVTQSEGLHDVYVDPMRVGQVLGNLISNAVKYGDPKTPIEIHLEQRESDVEIAVTNSGRGISPEDIPRLFGRFVRSKNARPSDARGLGVGLYIAKQLVEAHRGRIACDSTPGKTTTFRITLPSRQASIRAA